MANGSNIEIPAMLHIDEYTGGKAHNKKFEVRPSRGAGDPDKIKEIICVCGHIVQSGETYYYNLDKDVWCAKCKKKLFGKDGD